MGCSPSIESPDLEAGHSITEREIDVVPHKCQELDQDFVIEKDTERALDTTPEALPEGDPSASRQPSLIEEDVNEPDLQATQDHSETVNVAEEGDLATKLDTAIETHSGHSESQDSTPEPPSTHLANGFGSQAEYHEALTAFARSQQAVKDVVIEDAFGGTKADHEAEKDFEQMMAGSVETNTAFSLRACTCEMLEGEHADDCHGEWLQTLNQQARIHCSTCSDRR